MNVSSIQLMYVIHLNILCLVKLFKHNFWYSLIDTGVVTIDINSVIMVLRMLGFQTSISEQSELTTWLANNNCIYRGPDAVDTHIILVDREKLLNALDNFK